MEAKPPTLTPKAQRRQVQRSSNGCWTCKKRKKKCDETYPLCQRCIKAKITCFGYGEKPAWFERKSNSKSRKPNDGAAGGLHLAATSAFPYSIFANDAAGSGPTVSDGLLDKTARLKNHEAELLLYYLEFVFPLQWQYYKGSFSWLLPLLRQSKPLYQAVLSMSSLLVTLPLQEPSFTIDNETQTQHQLALQELRNTITFAQAESGDGLVKMEGASPDIEGTGGAGGSDTAPTTTGDDDIDPSITGQTVAAAAVAVATAAPPPPSSSTASAMLLPGIHSLVANVMLLSFELFQGGYQNWQQHIVTGSALVSMMTSAGTQPVESEAETFLVSAMIWMELVSTGTTGLPCPSSSFLDKLLETSPDLVPLEQIMGCKTKVLVQLNEVAKLNALKIDRMGEFKYTRPLLSLSSEVSDRAELDGNAGDVSDSTSAEVTATASEALSALIVSEITERAEVIKRELEFALTDSLTTDSTLIENTTRLYALAILIYLYGITSGFYPESTEISNAVERGIIILNNIPPKYYRSLVLPICIIGSMAKPHFHDFFEAVFGNDAHQLAFGNVSQVRKVIKHTWILRNTLAAVTAEQGFASSEHARTDVNWFDSMKDLNILVLLV
ncbi:C6 transcription factor [Sugiyamaella lignohabitans]|uniref:C6 transcription factor n=1 Tax=Sugiyamaella lignohabitans TaxID=796027 RepID=A0A167DIW6_9ASCO|nr:C6 transcription factor [Sugiyamaella lignohabitans]ANB12968.1 C6 transcription factor [Sugiyamaella lignohabitans]